MCRHFELLERGESITAASMNSGKSRPTTWRPFYFFLSRGFQRFFSSWHNLFFRNHHEMISWPTCWIGQSSVWGAAAGKRQGDRITVLSFCTGSWNWTKGGRDQQLLILLRKYDREWRAVTGGRILRRMGKPWPAVAPSLGGRTDLVLLRLSATCRQAADGKVSRRIGPRVRGRVDVLSAQSSPI